ncbi:N-acetylglucosamine-6-phosphate deacetylase [Roseimaritima ulvae]|uniref:N-acetylglucosamine-6-phosphate deacetylase n=1 Tax=Roseimaritima ulvae TaxID=980254 RepID=A0A5B9QZP2_9BACT|nr:amidohydrolase family protein [Roseimaritima ulvae]QEG43380.1 N-acetylglucosamine-6-phosphate deacetylase [Roseimaritima ulvae]
MSDFVDIQVNGYAGVDFNDDALSADDLHRACQAMRSDGVTAFLPTVITDTLDAMQRRLRQLVKRTQEDDLASQMVAGFHVEGPFLNPQLGYIGAHPTESTQLASVDAAKRLLDAAEGRVRIVTLAPERDPGAATTRFLADQQILVSAGHCDASLDELRRGIDAGLSMFTHLGNGCPVNLPRHDNIIQRVLAVADQLRIGLIADGHHIPLFALQNYLRQIPVANVILTTDAIAAAGLGPGTYPLAGRMVRVAENDAPRFDDSGQLAGSAATMPAMVQNLQAMGIDEPTIAAYCGGNARRVLEG